HDVFGDICETIGGTRHRDEFQALMYAAAGDAGNEPVVFWGRAGDDIFDDAIAGVVEYGDAGNDFLGCSDEATPTVFGGAGDDRIGMNSLAFGEVDGGPGIDSLLLSTCELAIVNLND